MKAWLEKHQRFTLHFTPTSSSWLNLVERWFRELTEKGVRRGNFESVPDLIAAIEERSTWPRPIRTPNRSCGMLPLELSWTRSSDVELFMRHYTHYFIQI